MSRRFLSRALATTAVAIGLPALGATSASAALPVNYNLLAAGTALGSPLRSPSGANDWNCVPTAAHPRPVVLVHATFTNMALNWNALSPLLKNNGYCVYAFNYGITKGSLGGYVNGLGPIEASGVTLSDFVDRVRSTTGIAKVDLVGHSQGGLLTRYYLNELGGSTKVHASIALGPTTHGTTLGGIVTLGDDLAKLFPPLKPTIDGMKTSPSAALQQQYNSSFITALNATPETMPGVKYTIISTKYDQVNTPWQSQQLRSPDADNIVLQDQCSVDFVDHVALAFDSIALRNVLNALDPANAKKPVCKFITPLIGG